MGFFDGVPSPMGTLKRIGRIGHAAWQVGDAVVGAVGWDYLRAPFVDDPKLNGFWHTILGRPVARAGDLAMATMGPQGIGGELIGAIPQDIRHESDYIVKPAMNYSNNLYRNVFSEPVSTMITMGSLIATEDTWHDPQGILGRTANLFDPNVWKEAYGIAQHRSPGQAEALALSNTDILDPSELKNFQGTDAYSFLSGSIDMFMRSKLDPQVLISQGIHAYRTPTPITAAESAVASPEGMANHINAQLAQARRFDKLAADLEAHNPEEARVLRLNAEKARAEIGLIDPDWTSKYHSDTLGVDRWRSEGLTNEVTPWYARAQSSYQSMMRESKGRPTLRARSAWAQDAMADLTDRVTRKEYPRIMVGHDDAGLPIFKSPRPGEEFNANWGDLRDATNQQLYGSGTAGAEPVFHKEGPMVEGEMGKMMTATEAAGAPHPNMEYDVKSDSWVVKKYDKIQVGTDRRGNPIFEPNTEGVTMTIPSPTDVGRSIGESPFRPELLSRATIQDLTPESLLKEADFGPGVKWTMNPDHIAFDATPRYYVPKGHEAERLAHVAHDPALVGRDLVDKPWTKANGVQTESLLGSVGSRNAQLDFKGVGAPAATVVDHTVGQRRPLVAVTVGTESDPSIVRATKKINSHPDIHTPSVQLMTAAKAEEFMANARGVLTEAAAFRDDLPNMPTGWLEYRHVIEERIGKSTIRAAQGVMSKLEHEFPEETWTGSLKQKRAMAERAYELTQQRSGDAIVTVDFNHLLTPEEIQTHPVTSGQLAHSDARITSPMVWDGAAQQYVRQDGRWDLHGDIRVKDPGLIPTSPSKIPVSAEAGGRTIMAPLAIDAATTTKMSRFGVTSTTAYGKIVARAMGLLHNPDPLYTEAADMGRRLVTFSKKEQELAYDVVDKGKKLPPGTQYLPIQDQVPPHLVPDKLYHTTGYADRIEASGTIEGRLGGGFGTDPYNLKNVPGVSLTSNEAAVITNERWLQEVVGPMVQALGDHPTEMQVAEYLTARVDDLMGDGVEAGSPVTAGAPPRQGGQMAAKDAFMHVMNKKMTEGGISEAAYGTVYADRLNHFAVYWQDSHNLLVTPEYLVEVPDNVIAKVHPDNVKTYVFDGTDVAGAPGALSNPFGNDEYRYYGDIPLAGKTPIEHGGYPTYASDIATGQEAATYPASKQALAVEREAARIRWEYDHNEPGPVTNERVWRAAAKLRTQFWPHDDQGARYAFIIASAHTADEMNLAFRTFLGDYRAANEVGIGNILLKKQLEHFGIEAAKIRGFMEEAERMDMVNSLGKSMTEYYDGQLKELQAQIDQTADQLNVRNQMLEAFGTMSQIPKATWSNELRAAVTTSEIYQTAIWAKPIKVIFNMMPHNQLNPWDPTSDIQFQRMMQRAGMHPDEVLVQRGRYMAAHPLDRPAIVSEVDASLVQRRMAESGLSRDDINELMKVASKQKQKAASVMNRSQYDALPEESIVKKASNILGVRFKVIEDANDIVFAPHWAETETSSTVFMTNFRELDRALGPINQWKQRYAGLRYALDVPSYLMNRVQQVWRSAVLARPAWPMRIIFDEQMRMAIKVGVLAELSALGEGFKGLTDYSFRKLGFKVDDIIPKADGFENSVIHQSSGVPYDTASAQFLSRVEQVGDDVDQLTFLEHKVTEAKNFHRQRQMREETLRQAMEESSNPNTLRLHQDAQVRLRDAKKNLDYWTKQREQTRAQYFKAPSGETRAAFDKANFAHYDSSVIYQERQAQAAEAARAAVGSRDQSATAAWKAAKSDLDEAAKGVSIAESARATHLARTSARMRLTMAERPGAEQMVTDADTQAQAVVNPEVQPGPAGPTRSAAKVGAVGGAVVGGVIGGPAGAAVGAGLGTLLMRKLATLEADGTDQMGVNSYRVQKAWGTAGDTKAVMQQSVSTHGQMYEFLDQKTRESIAGMEFDPQHWRTVPFSDPAHGIEWAKAMRNIQQDTMGQMILKMGMRSVDDPEAWREIQHWMLDTPEGRNYARRLPQRRGWEEEWIQQSIGQAFRYTKSFDPELMAKLEKGEAMPAMLDHIDPVDRPSVHGPELLSTLGKGVTGHLSKIMEKVFHVLGTVPTDHLSRMPYFNHVYEAEITRMLAPYPAGRIPEATIRTMETAAREHALNETKILLYDMAERSEFAEMAKFFMPFFGAWQEVLTRWTGLAIENPVFAARAIQVWGAPNKIPGLHYTDPNTGQQYIQFRIPEALKMLIGHGPLESALDSEGTVRFAKSSVSMLASGMPGFGPFVNLAVSQVVKQRPEVYDAVKSLLPYGVSDSTLDPFLPSAGRRLMSIAKGEDDAAFASTYHQVLMTRITAIMDGKDPKWGPEDLNTPETIAELFDEVHTETDKLYKIRLASSFLSPVALQFDSIYKPLVDEYRDMRQANPDTADQLFMDKYGDDMVYLTQAVTQTNNGVPPTLFGAEMEAKYGKLISEFPEYGSVIVGQDAGGESAKFMSQVYNKQLSTPVTPGSNVMQRSRLSPLEQLQAPQIRLGWQEFSRYMDKIDAYMIQNGYRTYAQAPNMRDFKNLVVSELAKKYPAWGNEYFTRDERKWQKRIDAFTAMTQTPGLKDRPDMQGVAEYLKYRGYVVQILEKRDAAGGSRDLFAQSNADIYDLWMTARMTLKEQNLQFADLYNRYFDRDPLSADPILGTSE